MYKVNWREAEAWNQYENTCVERDILSVLLPEEETQKKFAEYLSWAKVYCVRPGETMMSHVHNSNEFIYVLSGSGAVLIGEQKREIRRRDAFELPAEIAHAFVNPDQTQTLLFLSLISLDPRAGKTPEVHAANLTNDAIPAFAIHNWHEQKAHFELGHDDTLFWHGFPLSVGGNETSQDADLMFPGYLMCCTPVGVAMDGHLHHVGEIYFIDEGEAIVKVGNEEASLRDGDMVLLPADVPHAVKSVIEGQQLNLLIIGTSSELLPHGTDKKNELYSAVPEGYFKHE